MESILSGQDWGDLPLPMVMFSQFTQSGICNDVSAPSHVEKATEISAPQSQILVGPPR
jgi:hypothetical protein